jgi:branched-chain amino acid transport system ATP-binding protein
MEEINRQGVTLLLVEQNAVAALDFSHRAYVLETGRVALSGPSRELLNDPNVRCAYLGGAP